MRDRGERRTHSNEEQREEEDTVMREVTLH